MKSLLVFGRKGFVLLSILPLIVILMMSLSVVTLDVYRLSVQHRLLKSMDRFSLVEMTVLHQTLKQFLTYDPQDFEMEVGGTTVSVTFDDETASILYNQDLDLRGVLRFDLVFGYVIDYRLERNGDSD